MLPEVSIPITIPFDLPLLLHPVAVHFAVALPLFVLVLELANLLFKRRALSITSFVLMLVTLLVFVLAYFTGKTDGKEAWDLLSTEAQEALRTHRLLGTYLVYAMLVPLTLKLLSFFLLQKWVRGVLVLSMVVIVSFTFKQGYDGGKLVYDQGVNVRGLTDLRESMEALTDECADMNDTMAEQNQTIQTLKAQVDAYKQKEEEGFGDEVDRAVSEAVSKVKEMFKDDNTTQQSGTDGNESTPPARSVPEANLSKGSV